MALPPPTQSSLPSDWPAFWDGSSTRWNTRPCLAALSTQSFLVFSEESLKQISIAFANKAKDINNYIVDADEALALKHKEIIKKQSDLLKREFSDDVHIEMLELWFEVLECSIKARDVYTQALEYRIEVFEAQAPLNESAHKLMDHCMDAQEKIIDYKSAQVDKYQQGTKSSAAANKTKWALANEYLKEEIPLHRRINDARAAAAHRAGIGVATRRLIQMMPDPRKA